jgi:hypothetical protein
LFVFACYGNNITTLNCSGLSNVVLLACQSNGMTSLNISGMSSLIQFRADNNSLSQSQIDNLLATLVSVGNFNGQCDIDGNTAPSAAGITNKNILISRGWTVVTD